jgi:hypothetical protein
MERARGLREKAARYLRLSRSINSPADVAWLEALAAEVTQDANRIEAEEAAGVAERYPVYRLADEPPGGVGAGPVAREDSDALTKRDVEFELDEVPDRRRPGRRDEVSPVLIPLLREDSITSLPGEFRTVGHDDLSASRGVIIWTLISLSIMLLVLWIVGRI